MLNGQIEMWAEFLICIAIEQDPGLCDCKPMALQSSYKWFLQHVRRNMHNMQTRNKRSKVPQSCKCVHFILGDLNAYVKSSSGTCWYSRAASED